MKVLHNVSKDTNKLLQKWKRFALDLVRYWGQPSALSLFLSFLH